MKLPAPRKRRKTVNSTASKTSRSKADSGVIVGQLKNLLEMPLDILYEVFMHLQPQDVISLSRTSKYIRGLVMSKAWSAVWRAALDNDPDMFPAKPDDLNEPQYVSLICDRFCDTCLVEDMSIMFYWCFRRRLCAACEKHKFMQLYQVLQRWPDINTDLTTFLSLLVNDIVHYNAVYQAEDGDLVKAELQSCQDPKAVELYKAKRTKKVDQCNKFRDDCRDAVLRRQLRTSKEIEEARSRRKTEILNRLNALGWSEELMFLEQTNPRALSEHEAVYSTAPLTDENFTRLYPRVLALLNTTREKVIHRKQKRLNGTRLQLLSKMLEDYATGTMDKVIPTLADIAFIPKIRNILRIKDISVYSTEESFNEVRAELPKMSKEWQRSKSESLVTHMPQGMNFSHLSLAIAFFQCHECTEPISYPRILAHSCLRKLRTGYRNREDDVVRLLAALGEEPWNLEPRNGVQWHPYAVACAVDVVSGFGLQPNTATAHNMDTADVEWVECLGCRDPVKQRSVVYQWRSAIIHGLKHLRAGKAAVWSPVTRPEDVRAAEDEDERQSSRAQIGTHHKCIQCHAKVYGHLRREHLRLAHDVQQPGRLETQFTLDCDAPLDLQPYSVLIPLAARPSNVAPNVKSKGKGKEKEICIDLTDDTDIIDISDSDSDSSSVVVLDG